MKCLRAVVESLDGVDHPVIKLALEACWAKALARRGAFDQAQEIMDELQPRAHALEARWVEAKCWVFMHNALMRSLWPNEEGLMHAVWTRVEVFRDLAPHQRERLERIEDALLAEGAAFEVLQAFFEQPTSSSNWYEDSELLLATRLLVQNNHERHLLPLLSQWMDLSVQVISHQRPGKLMQRMARMASVVEWSFAHLADLDAYMRFANQLDVLVQSHDRTRHQMTSSIMEMIIARACAANDAPDLVLERLGAMTALWSTMHYRDVLELASTHALPLLLMCPSKTRAARGFAMVTRAVNKSFEAQGSPAHVMETIFVLACLIHFAQTRDVRQLPFARALKWPMNLYPERVSTLGS